VRVGEASNQGLKDWDIPMSIDEVLTLQGTVAFDLEPYDEGYPQLIGVIMLNKTRSLFIAPHHPIEGRRVITMMCNDRSVSADFGDTELSNWLRAKVGGVLSIESLDFYQSGSLSIMDWDAMENLTDLPSWMYARATHVSKYVNVGFKLYTDSEASRQGVAPSAAFVAQNATSAACWSSGPNSSARRLRMRESRTSRSKRGTCSSTKIRPQRRPRSQSAARRGSRTPRQHLIRRLPHRPRR
jgi:hypothetical protein